MQRVRWLVRPCCSTALPVIMDKNCHDSCSIACRGLGGLSSNCSAPSCCSSSPWCATSVHESESGRVRVGIRSWGDSDHLLSDLLSMMAYNPCIPVVMCGGVQRFGWPVQLWVSAIMLFNMGVGITAEYTALGNLFSIVIGSSRIPIVVIVGVVSSIYTGTPPPHAYANTIRRPSLILW